MLVMSGLLLKILPAKENGKSKTARILVGDRIYSVSVPLDFDAPCQVNLDIAVELREYQGRSYFVMVKEQ